MFTTLIAWLRPSARRTRRGPAPVFAAIERLEDRAVPDATPWQLQVPDANGFPSPHPLMQDWSNPGLITTNSWAGVPSITGFLGNGLTSTPGVDPRTILGGTSTAFVSANQTDPDNFATGGPAEFDTLTDPTYGPTVALKGDATARAPYLQFYLDTRQAGDVTISYVLRDIDNNTLHNSQQQFALQYRIGNTGNFTTVPATFGTPGGGYVSDATTNPVPPVSPPPPVGPPPPPPPPVPAAITPVSVRLPAALNNQPLVEIRVITSDAAGVDEWVGVDNIVISGNVAPVIQLPDATYLENDPATLIAPAATLTDLDGLGNPTADFGPNTGGYPAGSMRVDFSPHSAFTTDDVFKIQDQGTGNGQISVIGAQVFYTDMSGTKNQIGLFTGGLATAPLVVSFTTNFATPEAVQALLRAITYQNASDNPNPNPRALAITVDDGDGSTGTATLPMAVFDPFQSDPALTITPVDDPPVLTLSGGTVTFTEDGPPVAVDDAATVTDIDSPAFNGGSLTFAFDPLTPATPDDVLAVPNQGTGSGQIGVVGTTVTFSGITIGTINPAADGTNGNPLEVDFNPVGFGTNVTPAMVQTLLRAIAFSNTSNNPDPAPRSLVVTVNDGGSTDNGGDPTATGTRLVAITPVNDAPTVATTPGTLTIGEKANPGVVIDSGATVMDPDSANFSGGSLRVDFASGGTTGDRFAIQSQGFGAGQIGVSGGSVFFGGQFLGFSSGGSNGAALNVSFSNSNSTPAAVTALLQNITFRTTSLNPPAAVRQAEFTVSDGSGGTSTPATRGIQITPVNDAPVITTSGTVNYQAGLTPVAVSSGGILTDPDSPTLNGGQLSAQIQPPGAQPGDGLAVRNQGTGAGQVGVSGNTVSFGGLVIGTVSGDGNATPLVVLFTTTDATPAAAQAVLRNITFHTPNGPTAVGNRTVSFQATDDQGAVGNVAARTVAVNTGSANSADDFYDTDEDVPLVVPAPGVLANDGAGTVVDGVVNGTGPAHGTVILNPNGSFTYTPAANYNGTDSFQYSFSGAATGTATVTITVHAVNDPPAAVYNPGVPVTVNEDSGPQSFPLFVTYNPGGGQDEATQILTFLTPYTNTNTDLFSIQPAIDAQGNLTFTPAPDAFGTSTVSITVQDSGGTTGNALDQDTITLTFDIVVRPVNDQPTLHLLGDPPAVGEDAGPQAVPGFAFNFTPGPANESDQTPTYILTLAGLTGGLSFSAPPAIAPDGTLTYTTAPNRSGTATFDVVVKDSGGTANGGVDTSTPEAFTITVNPVNDPPTLGPDTATVNWNTGPNPIDVLANDSDAPDAGETLTVVGVTPGTSGGVAAITGGGTGVSYQPPPAFVGTDTFTYTVSDGNGGLSTATVTVTVVRPETAARDIIALGAGPGGGSLVRVFDSKTGAFVAGFTAFDPSFKGGVSVATGDVNGDGVPDVIVGAGAGGGPRIMVIDGTKFGLLQGTFQIANPAAILANMYVYDPSFTGGVTVAAGDIDGDGKADVVVGAGPGGGPNVKVISGARIDRIGPDGLPDDSAVLASFFAYDSGFRGGINVAAGDVTGDGFADLITTAGNGGGSHVKAFDGFRLVQSGPTGAGVLRASFFAYDPSFRGGVFVAAGDVDGDGVDDIITGAGPGGGSNVKVFELSNPFTPIDSFYAFGPGFGGGVDVAYRARSGGASPWLVAGAASGESRVLGIGLPGLDLEASFDAFDPQFLGGVDVG